MPIVQKWRIDNRIWMTGGLVAVLILTAIAAGFGLGSMRGRTAPAPTATFMAPPTVLPTTAAASGDLPTVAPDASAPTAVIPESTPAPTPAPTSPPAPVGALSPNQMAQAYADSAALALNDIPGLDFTSTRAASLLRRLAQEQGLVFVPISFAELAGESWAVLAAPRTPAGEPLPILLWRDARDRSVIHSQVVADMLDAPDWAMGLAQGRIVTAGQGYAVLLIAKPGETDRLPVILLTQPQAGANFDLGWRSLADPQWIVQAAGSSLEIQDTAAHAFIMRLYSNGPNDALERTECLEACDQIKSQVQKE